MNVTKQYFFPYKSIYFLFIKVKSSEIRSERRGDKPGMASLGLVSNSLGLAENGQNFSGPSLPRRRPQGSVTRFLPHEFVGEETRDEPLRTSAWEAIAGHKNRVFSQNERFFPQFYSEKCKHFLERKTPTYLRCFGP